MGNLSRTHSKAGKELKNQEGIPSRVKSFKDALCNKKKKSCNKRKIGEKNVEPYWKRKI